MWSLVLEENSLRAEPNAMRAFELSLTMLMVIGRCVAGAGVTVAATQKEITLTFKEKVGWAFISIAVADGNGKEVSL